MTREYSFLLGSLDRFNHRFESDFVTLPRNVAALAYSAQERTWYCAPDGLTKDGAFRHRVPLSLRFLSRHVVPNLSTDTL